MSTVFETELIGIDGVKAEEPPAKPAEPAPAATTSAAVTDDEVNQDNEEAAPENVAKPTSTALDSKPSETADAKQPAAAHGNPLDGESGNGECNLLGDFALLVQAALGLLAVSSLAVKRMREHPRRPLKIWFFDVSKQVFGSVLLHLANVLMSMLSSGKFDVATVSSSATTQLAGEDGDADQPNPSPNGPIPWGIGNLVDPSQAVPPPPKGTNVTSPAAGANSTSSSPSSASSSPAVSPVGSGPGASAGSSGSGSGTSSSIVAVPTSKQQASSWLQECTQAENGTVGDWAADGLTSKLGGR